jgi:hypothetical protein
MRSQGPWDIPVHRCDAVALALYAWGGAAHAEIQNFGGGTIGRFNGDAAPTPA